MWAYVVLPSLVVVFHVFVVICDSHCGHVISSVCVNFLSLFVIVIINSFSVVLHSLQYHVLKWFEFNLVKSCENMT